MSFLSRFAENLLTAAAVVAFTALVAGVIVPLSLVVLGVSPSYAEVAPVVFAVVAVCAALVDRAGS